jgi:hypothetical protein
VSDRSAKSPRVEELLAIALERASAAGEWAVVALLARELEARRGAAGSTSSFDERLKHLAIGRDWLHVVDLEASAEEQGVG